MAPILRILVSSRSTLLQSSDLSSLCEKARRLRAISAAICLTTFLIALLIVIGYRALPFALVPPALAGSLLCFVASAATASRLGRLTDARLNVEYAQRIGHLIDINPACSAYEHAVRQQHRPFTRLDLEELGAIHLANPVGK